MRNADVEVFCEISLSNFVNLQKHDCQGFALLMEMLMNSFFVFKFICNLKIYRMILHVVTETVTLKRCHLFSTIRPFLFQAWWFFLLSSIIVFLFWIKKQRGISIITNGKKRIYSVCMKVKELYFTLLPSCNNLEHSSDVNCEFRVVTLKREFKTTGKIEDHPYITQNT